MFVRNPILVVFCKHVARHLCARHGGQHRDLVAMNIDALTQPRPPLLPLGQRRAVDREDCACPDAPRILLQYAILGWRLLQATFLWGAYMRFDRSAGGHNFDFDTDVCTRCGIARRHYRDGGTPGCTDKKVVRLVAAIDAPSPRSNVPSTRLSTPSPIVSA
jgi:hypothetical protein